MAKQPKPATSAPSVKEEKPAQTRQTKEDKGAYGRQTK